MKSMFYDNISVDNGSYYYGMGWNYSTQMYSKPILLHLVIDVICLLLCFVSLWSVLTIGRWNRGEKNKNIYVADCLRHIILPMFLLSIPLIMGIPVRVLWLFVKDICICLYVNTGVLIAVGIYKMAFLMRVTYKKKFPEADVEME